MARTPFKLKSQGSSFKQMGSSPAKKKPIVDTGIKDPDTGQVLDYIHDRKHPAVQEDRWKMRVTDYGSKSLQSDQPAPKNGKKKANATVTKTKKSKTKSYSEAYKDADKSKYKTEAEFITAAKAYNTKKYGTTEPTKESKKLVGKHKGAYVSGDKPEDYVTKKGAKGELATRHKTKVETTAALEADVKRRDADIKSGKARKIVSPVTGEDAVAYGKPTPKTKKRTKTGKLGVQIGNIFRKKNKKKNPHRKTIKK